MQEIPLKSKIATDQLWKVGKMKEVIKPTKPHKHDGYFEIIFLYEGAGFHTIDNTIYEVEPPLIHMLKPGQVHCWNFSQIPKGYVMMFKEEVLTEYSNSLSKLYELPAELKLEQSFSLLKLMEQCYMEYKADSLSGEMMSAYLNLIILKLTQFPQKPANGSTLNLLYAYKKLIEEKYRELRLVSEYADALNSSSAKLNEVCQTALGKNANAIIKERILLEAKNMLYHTEKTVTEIALDLQFSDTSNFVRFFKSHTCFTPQQYRNMI